MQLNEMKSSPIVFLIKSSSKCGSAKRLSSELLKEPSMISVLDETRTEGLWGWNFCRHSVRLRVPPSPLGWAVSSQSLRHNHSKQCTVWGHCPQSLVAAWRWIKPSDWCCDLPEARLGRWNTESRRKLLDFTAFYLGVIYFGENSVRNYVLGYFEDIFPTF